jgi:flagellar basal body-associated protein FliL
MEIKSLQQKKKQKTLMIIVLVIMLAAFLIFYFGFIKKGTEVSLDDINEPGVIQFNPATTALEEELKNVDLNTDFLINKILSVLKTNGDMPVRKGVTGRSNPFVQ